MNNKSIVILLTLLLNLDVSAHTDRFYLNYGVEASLPIPTYIDNTTFAGFRIENDDFVNNGLDSLEMFVREACDQTYPNDYYIEIPIGCRDVLQFLMLCSDMQSNGIYLPMNDYNLFAWPMNYVESRNSTPPGKNFISVNRLPYIKVWLDDNKQYISADMLEEYKKYRIKHDEYMMKAFVISKKRYSTNNLDATMDEYMQLYVWAFELRRMFFERKYGAVLPDNNSTE